MTEYSMHNFEKEFFSSKLDEAIIESKDFREVLEKVINNKAIKENSIIIKNRTLKGNYFINKDDSEHISIVGQNGSLFVKANFILDNITSAYKMTSMEVSNFNKVSNENAIITEKEFIYSDSHEQFERINYTFRNMIKTKSFIINCENLKENSLHFFVEYNKAGSIDYIHSAQSRNTYNLDNQAEKIRLLLDNKHNICLSEFINLSNEKTYNDLMDLYQIIIDRKDNNRSL